VVFNNKKFRIDVQRRWDYQERKKLKVGKFIFKNKIIYYGKHPGVIG